MKTLGRTAKFCVYICAHETMYIDNGLQLLFIKIDHAICYWKKDESPVDPSFNQFAVDPSIVVLRRHVITFPRRHLDVVTLTDSQVGGGFFAVID